MFTAGNDEVIADVAGFAALAGDVMVDVGLFAAGEVGDADGGGDDEVPHMEVCEAVLVSLLTAKEGERI